jgi:hypothetical protein
LSARVRHWGVDFLCQKQSKNAGQADARHRAICRALHCKGKISTCIGPSLGADTRRRAGIRRKSGGSSIPGWQHVEAELTKAAAGAEPMKVYVALQMVLPLERVEYEMT